MGEMVRWSKVKIVQLGMCSEAGEYVQMYLRITKVLKSQGT